MKICRNCGAQVNSAYCGDCGQRPVPDKITLHYIWHELLHFFTHAEKGFFFTTFGLVKKPGPLIVDFLGGKRKDYQKPVSYYLIWIGIYSLLLLAVEKLFGENRVVSFANYFGPGETTKFAISHLNIVLTLLLPVQAIYMYAILMGQKYNYMEALVAVLYIIGTLIFLQVVFVLLSLLIFLPTGQAVSIQWSDIVKVLYFAWVLMSLSAVLTIKAKFVRAITVLLLVGGTFTAWRLYVSPSFANLFF